MRTPVNIVWFKRDLRLTDHEPLHCAIEQKLPIILLYIFEEDVIEAAEYDLRHWRFVWESLTDLQTQLSKYGHSLSIKTGSAKETLESIHRKFVISHIFSHEETGIKITYERDLTIQKWTKEEGIRWIEFQRDGVKRGRKNRKDWVRDWYRFMSGPVKHIDLSELESQRLENDQIDPSFSKLNPVFQPGGTSYAKRYLKSFLTKRIKNYSRGLSKPTLSRTSCSRLSPYLAWGNISMREVYQSCLNAPNFKAQKFNYTNFLSRLRWHCHFIQKFEMEDRMEFESLNSGFKNMLKYDHADHLRAWQEGLTGIPMVDANMRCLTATGYINFRMRAMLVSFATLHLWLAWKPVATWMAKHFLDFEPGIHYPQIQMQAGVTGINTVRMYNPIKQGMDHDREGVFIKKWIPELELVPIEYIHEPHLMPPLESAAVKFSIGASYPLPIIDLETSAKSARATIWEFQKHPEVVKEAKRILRRHTVTSRKV